MKTIKVIIVGYGNRGQVYADYALQTKDEIEIVGIVDPDCLKLQEAKLRYGLTDDKLFKDWKALLDAKVKADLVVNATMDQIHYETCIDILNAKYDMLVEKPIVNNEHDLLDIANLAKKNNCQVFVCHVLRYTPFYRLIKQTIKNNEIGNIISLEMNEHVWIPHYLTSYDRGKWNSEDSCGSGLLLAKCCHDLDLISWLNNETKPRDVVSFGSRSLFVPQNKPEDAADYCYNCKHQKNCIYNATELYLDCDPMPFLTWSRINKPLEEITKKEKAEFLKKDIFGKCAYDCGGNIVDRQNLLINFDNGSICSFSLIAGSTKADRYIHVVGTKGEIEGKIESNKVTIRKYVGPCKFTEDVIDLNNEVINKAQFGGHSGGDFMIMHDIVRYLNGDKSSISITSIDDSIRGHLLVYAAEKSRKTHVIVPLEF